MRCRVISQIPHDGIPIQRDRAGTDGAAAIVSMWPVLGIGSQVPKQYISAPVLRSSNNQMRNRLRNCKVRITLARDNHLLREVKVLLWKGIMRSSHRGNLAAIQMETGAIGILLRRIILKNVDGIVRMIAIMVEADDLSHHSGLRHCWPQIVADEVRFFL